jgi:Ig-like domain from next to BRCA1 gene
MYMSRYDWFVSDVCLRFGLLLFAMVLTIGCRNSTESGAQSADSTTPPSAGAQRVQARAATFVDQKVPTEMVADHPYTVSVRMRNTGSVPWTTGENFRLGSVNPLDNEVWGLRRVVVTKTVAPGQETTFVFAVKSPGTEGEYTFQWRMVQDGVDWFGDETRNVAVTVTRPKP